MGGEGARWGSARWQRAPQWGSQGRGWRERAASSPTLPLPAGPVITPVPMGPRSYRVRRVPSSCPLPRPGLPSWLPKDCREPRELCGDRLRWRGLSAGPPLGQPPGM